MRVWRLSLLSFFFFNDTATTEIYTLSLHDALPISIPAFAAGGDAVGADPRGNALMPGRLRGASRRCRRCDSDTSTDRKSTRLNSSHGYISYAVFCLKKKSRFGERGRRG